MPERLELKAKMLRDGYQVDPSNDILRTEVYGASRQRVDFEGATTIATVQWALSPDEFDYLMAFYNVYKGLSISIDLTSIDYEEFREYTAYFITKPRAVDFSSNLRVVTAQLEVEPSTRDSDYDTALLAAVAMFGGDADFAAYSIDLVMNVELPEATNG